MRRHDYIISQPTLNVKETSLPKIFFIKQVKQLEEKKTQNQGFYFKTLNFMVTFISFLNSDWLWASSGTGSTHHHQQMS